MGTHYYGRFALSTNYDVTMIIQAILLYDPLLLANAVTDDCDVTHLTSASWTPTLFPSTLILSLKHRDQNPYGL